MTPKPLRIIRLLLKLNAMFSLPLVFTWPFFRDIAPKVGEIVYQPTQHVATAAEVFWTKALIVGAYFLGINVFIGISWIVYRVVFDALYLSDPEYGDFRDNGGDPFLDFFDGPP